MWIEAILAREDFVRIVDQLLPLKIAIGDNGDHLSLHDPGEVTLVPDQGVRLGCKASVRYTLIGIAVPIVLHTVTVLLKPEISKREGGRDALTFSVVIEDADLAGIPAVIDAKIRDKVNALMKTKRVAFAWEFGDMLTQTVQLPPSLRPLDSMSLEVAWGKFKVTDEAFVMAISFHSSVARDGVAPAVAEKPKRLAAPAPVPVPEVPTTALARTHDEDVAPLVLGGAALALAIGGAYGVLRLTTREPSGILRRPRRNGSILSQIAAVAATSVVVAIGGQVASRLARTLLSPRAL